MKKHESKYNPAVKELSELLIGKRFNNAVHPIIKAKMISVLDGIEHMDEMISQKDTELQSTKQILLDKEQKEWVKVLHQRFPHDYPANFSEWSNNSWGKDVVNRKDLQAIEKHLPTFKVDVLNNKFIEVLHQRFPHDYPANFRDWSNIWGKDVINRGDIEAMEKWIPIYEKEIQENLKQSVLSKNNLLAQKEQLLVQKDNLINQKNTELQSKDNLLLQKELEKQELVRQKEIEKQELLAQKEAELHDKSLAKNQVIGELHGALSLQEKEALYSQIELLIKQLEFKAKEVELKDKALEDANEIVKQNKIINELQGKLLEAVNLYKNDDTLKLDLSVIAHQVEESVENKNINEMEELSKQLSLFIKNPIEKDVNISELLKSLELSPVVKENSINHPVEVNNNANISNFIDINHINTTHSFLVSMSGEGSQSYEIVDTENFH
jgi:hypothetical protein